MSESAVLESAPIEVVAPPAMEIERGPLVNLTPEQRKEYRSTGTLPKIEASATSPANEGDSGTPKQQEKPKNEAKPKQTAEERIAQLEATIERIKAGKGLESKPKAESAPAKSEPVTLNAKPTPDDKNADGTPKYQTHSEYEEAVMGWKIEKHDADKAAAAEQAANDKALDAKMDKARSRYGEDVDVVIDYAVKQIAPDKDFPGVIKQMLYDSDLSAELVYTLASNKEDFASFLKMSKENPGKAIRYVALTESLISQEFEAQAKTTETITEPPAKLKTQAPRPPAEAGGRAATPPDSLQAALDGSGGKLNAGLKAEFLRRDLARLKG